MSETDECTSKYCSQSSKMYYFEKYELKSLVIIPFESYIILHLTIRIKCIIENESIVPIVSVFRFYAWTTNVISLYFHHMIIIL